MVEIIKKFSKIKNGIALGDFSRSFAMLRVRKVLVALLAEAALSGCPDGSIYGREERLLRSPWCSEGR